ncbi:PREDICTED: uncharacterized protein LOC104806890 [Tarenaya hassleriana]|uniref:uncharacterized protein LOC104806890 n=1 Tax=Tarenaya hassleriana TaxID=28532 RepID=UPI00053C362C|nr:PREDICTED: uncharacterized protein LOC104806890 [Tarenaya hassleriana]
MEDPAKRKERLRAMQTEAAQINASAETSMNPSQLSNPFAETSGPLPSQEESYQTQRFDYYTDPLSAFSSNKRNKTHQRIEQHYSSSPVSQFPPSIPGPVGNTYQPHNSHGGFQAEGQYHSGSPHIDPRGMTNPSFVYRGTPQESWNNFRHPAPNFRPFHSPHPVPGTFLNHQAIPDPANRFGGQGNYNRPPIPGYARPFSNYGRQNSNWAGRMGSGSGRGRGDGGRNMNSSFGRNGGRGQKYDDGGYRAQGPERFYDKSMSEDPWKNLEPVLWKSCPFSCTSSSTGQAWLPMSIVRKKPTVAETSSNKSSSAHQSLAEYLAASLDEATRDDASQ